MSLGAGLARLAAVVVVVVVVVIGFPGAHSLSTQFSFSHFPSGSGDMIWLGDAVSVEGVMELTGNDRTSGSCVSSSSSSTGRALYSKGVQFVDASSNHSASFSTVFSFAMLFPPNASILREGLAFVLVPDKVELGDSGSQLGIYNSSNLWTSRHTVAVIFETSSTKVGVNDNHVGVAVGNTTSLFSTDLRDASMSFRNGSVITAWIDYDSQSSSLEVRVGYDAGQRPREATLYCRLDLGSIVEPVMYVGFCASDIGSDCEPRHSIYSWNLSSYSGGGGGGGPGSSVGRRRRRLLLAGFCVLIFSITMLACGSVVWLRHKQKAIGRFRKAEMYEREVHYSARNFSYKELSLATKSFSDKEKLVGSGSVYRGVLPDCGYLVAVKRIPETCSEESLAQVTLLAQLRHRNLVHLHGWCQKEGELLLVYEFMPNGSLDSVLLDRNGDVLSWCHRFKIVAGVASALKYLHHGWEQVVLHRDIKASNVLLDNSFNARLGDFGVAQLVSHCHKGSGGRVIAGTFGYLAPETVQTGKCSEKTDVFSFGAVSLEVACGRKPLDTCLPPEQAVLVDWVWELHCRGRVEEAADPRLQGSYERQEMQTLLLVGLACTQPDAQKRPSMAQVVDILAGHAALLPPLPPPPSSSAACYASALSMDELLGELQQMKHSF